MSFRIRFIQMLIRLGRSLRSNLLQAFHNSDVNLAWNKLFLSLSLEPFTAITKPHEKR